jgi:hypothetical protein
VRNQFALDHFFGQQPHRPTCSPFWRRRADHRDNALLLLLIKSRSLARTGGIEHRPLQSAIKIPLADLPHRLGGKSQAGAHRRRGLPLIQLAQGQSPQGRPYRLQPARQQLIDLLSIALLEFNLKSYASAHSSAIQSEPAPNKYLRWLPIHAVAVLVLLCYEVFVPQKGHWHSLLSRLLARRMRRVAIECGLWRSGRTRAAWVELWRQLGDW